MIKPILSIVIICTSILFGSAQEVWTLQKCVAHALQNNLNIAQLKLSSLNSGVILYNGGRLKNTVKQAEINEKSATMNVRQNERDIALFVANAYLQVLFAKENLKIVENQIALSKEQLSQLDKLIRAGTRPANERLSLDAQIATNEQSQITAENAVATALLNLKQLMRLQPEKEIEVTIPAEEVPLLNDADLLSFSEVYNSALGTQPNIEAGRLDVTAAEVGVEIAESALLPSLSAGASLGTNYSNRGIRLKGLDLEYETVNILFNNMPTTIGIEQAVPVFEDNPYFSQLNDNLSVGAGINLSVPIYNNHVSKNNIERAKLNIQNVKLNNELLKDNLKTNVQQALSDARNAKRAFAAAELGLEAQKRYELGSLNTYDYIDAKNQLDVANLNLVIAKYDYIFKAKVIDFYMGYPLKLN